MKDFSLLESAYRPTQADIEALTLEKFIETNHTLLNGVTTTNVYHSLRRIGINSLRALYEADLKEVEVGYRIGSKKLDAILNLKSEIVKELTEGES